MRLTKSYVFSYNNASFTAFKKIVSYPTPLQLIKKY